MVEHPDQWQAPKKILVILAHPDDPEFFCGATLARWALAGHEIHYFILTCGDKGAKLETEPGELCRTRHEEQLAAGKIIGVKAIEFLDLEDGYIMPTLELRKEMVRVIRRVKPDILVTCDPTRLYSGDRHVNHPDHRYTGQVVLDAVFPAAGNGHFFPELLKSEGLTPHTPQETWISLAENPNITLDVTDTWEIKIRALKEHASQVGDPTQFEERMHKFRTPESSKERPHYEEKFRRLVHTS